MYMTPRTRILRGNAPAMAQLPVARHGSGVPLFFREVGVRALVTVTLLPLLLLSAGCSRGAETPEQATSQKGCPAVNSGVLPPARGLFIIDASGRVASVHPRLRCPQKPGTLAVVPGSRIVLNAAPVTLSRNGSPAQRPVLKLISVPSGYAPSRPATAFRVVRFGWAQIEAPKFRLTVVSSLPTS
jgi:hypothetical protein